MLSKVQASPRTSGIAPPAFSLLLVIVLGLEPHSVPGHGTGGTGGNQCLWQSLHLPETTTAATLEAASPMQPGATLPSLPQAMEQTLPLMLVGNKLDLQAGLPEAARVCAAQGQHLAMVSGLGQGLPGWQGAPDIRCSPRSTSPCSVRPAPRTAPTWWRPCCTWHGEEPCHPPCQLRAAQCPQWRNW